VWPGHAGPVLDVDDLSIFAQMLLDGAHYNGARILTAFDRKG